MYKLYWSSETGAFAAQAVLEEVDAQYQRIVDDTNKGEHLQSQYLAINPRGQIPGFWCYRMDR
ncbi:MAG: hypothetical protein OEU36_18370 [Gammaproteobacteria bacterium]|nr:hypothetical protein [Gammaproteobacteria bacterium]